MNAKRLRLVKGFLVVPTFTRHTVTGNRGTSPILALLAVHEYRAAGIQCVEDFCNLIMRGAVRGSVHGNTDIRHTGRADGASFLFDRVLAFTPKVDDRFDAEIRQAFPALAVGWPPR